MTSILIDNKALDIFQILSFISLTTLAVIASILGLVWFLESFIRKDSNGR